MPRVAGGRGLGRLRRARARGPARTIARHRAVQQPAAAQAVRTQAVRPARVRRLIARETIPGTQHRPAARRRAAATRLTI